MKSPRLLILSYWGLQWWFQSHLGISMFQLTLLNHTLLASCTWLYNIYFTYPRSFFCFSEGIRTRFALVFGDSVIFILWFNLLEFLWIYFTEKKIQAKFDFIILRWINHKTPPLSLSLSLSQTGCNIQQIQKIKYIQHYCIC